MKKIILFAVFAMIGLTAVAQEKSSSNSKWKETKNGVTYQMEVTIEGSSDKTTQKPHVTLTIVGDIANLKKLILTKKDNMNITLPVSKEAQEINVEPGQYTFKFYHEGLGEQKFEVDLKTGDNKKMVLTLK